MASTNRNLSTIGKYLILLDNCCNIQISNWSLLFSEIYKNRDSGANTLGGVYSPSLKGNSPFIGCSLLDEDAAVRRHYAHSWQHVHGDSDGVKTKE